MSSISFWLGPQACRASPRTAAANDLLRWNREPAIALAIIDPLHHPLRLFATIAANRRRLGAVPPGRATRHLLMEGLSWAGKRVWAQPPGAGEAGARSPRQRRSTRRSRRRAWFGSAGLRRRFCLRR